jgi:uncharacterized membrane protein YbhN (UPF0104 family)
MAQRRSERLHPHFRRLLSLALKALVSALALAWLFSVIDWEKLARRVQDIDWLRAGCSFALASLSLPVCAWRWRQVSRRCGLPLAAGEALQGYLIGSFFNSFLPTDKGGDVMRGIWVARGRGYPASRLLGTVLFERASGLAMIGCWSLAFGLGYERRVAPIRGLTVSAALVLAALAILAWLLSRNWCRRLVGRLPFAGLRQATWNMLDAWRPCLCSASTMTAVTGFSLLNLLVLVAAAWLRGSAIAGFNAPLYGFALVVPLTFIAGLLLSIGGYGIREASLVIGFGWFGVAPEAAALYGLLNLAGRWIIAAVGAAIFVGTKSRIHRRTAAPWLEARCHENERAEHAN